MPKWDDPKVKKLLSEGYSPQEAFEKISNAVQNIVYCANTNVPSGASTPLSFSGGTVTGADLLDFTDPLNPTVKESGEYRVEVSVGCVGQPGKFASLWMGLDLNGASFPAQANFSMDDPTGGVGANFALSNTAPIPAGGAIGIYLIHNAGAPVAANLTATVTKIG
jgi:hypothetical protein